MSDNFLCCEKCFELIGRESPKAAKMWLNLCDIAFKSKGIFGLITDDEISLRLLEISGFLMSTEQKDHLSIKMFGEQEGIDGIVFCPRDCLDDEM